MIKLAFRLTDITDPEERLEEAALWKAMFDYWGPDTIKAFGPNDEIPQGIPVFGRSKRFSLDQNPVSSDLDYWEDPVFIENCNREFHFGTLDDMRTVARSMQQRGMSLFVKAARAKYHTQYIAQDQDFDRALGPMAYSFCNGETLMLQEFCKIEFEHRFFVVDRKIITGSPNMVSLTPLDFPLPAGTVFQTPNSKTPIFDHRVLERYEALANDIAASMATPHACIDLALINGKPAIVEFNPMQIGHLGLFASDVRALAAATKSLVEHFEPAAKADTTTIATEEPFVDL
jgi:hypothetical protein